MGLLYPKCEFALSPAVTEETSLEINSGLKPRKTRSSVILWKKISLFFFLSQSQALKSGNSKVVFSHMIEFFFFFFNLLLLMMLKSPDINRIPFKKSLT